MRNSFSVASAYGVGAFVVMFVAQWVLGVFVSAFKGSVAVLLFASSLVSILLFVGALAAFLPMKRAVATQWEAMALGGLAAIPATMVGMYAAWTLGPVVAVMVVVLLAGVIAALGGGALRQRAARG